MNIKKTCIICNNSFEVPYSNRNKKTCSKKCFKLLAHNIKINAPHKEESNLKRRKTNLERYNRISALAPGKQTKILKRDYNILFKKLNNIHITELYSKDKLSSILNTNKFHYSKYIGKSKNRTLIIDDPILYKSLLHHTQFIENKKLYGEKHVPLSMKLLIAGKHKFIITEDMYCRCKNRLSFNHQNLTFDKLYCEKCRLNANSKEHFKYKFGEDWEYYFDLNCKKYIKQGYINGYKNVIRNYKLFGKMYCPNIGTNEIVLLDKQEKIDNCKIDRNFYVGRFHPDGYCHETNTLYEVYEPYHKYQKERDIIRLDTIQKHINCKICIIYDGWNGT